MNQPPVAFDMWIDPRRLAYLEGLERCLLAGPRLCPNCGKPMAGSVPAQDAPVAVPAEPPKKTYESWRDREPLL